MNGGLSMTRTYTRNKALEAFETGSETERASGIESTRVVETVADTMLLASAAQVELYVQAAGDR